MIGKWLGGICILCASWGMGLWLASQWRGRLRALETLRRMVYFLKGEITYGHTALVVICSFCVCRYRLGCDGGYLYCSQS